MKVIRKNEEWLVLAEPISDANISKARFHYGEQNNRPPRYLKMSRKALADICTEYKIAKIPVSFTNESIQGLLIEIDPALADGEWVVGNKEERIYEVKQ